MSIRMDGTICLLKFSIQLDIFQEDIY